MAFLAALHPNGNGAEQAWDVSDYTNVDDGDEQPTAPSDGNDCHVGNLGGPEEVSWTVPNIPATPGIAAKAHVWLYNTDAVVELVKVEIDSVLSAGTSTIQESVGNWDRYEFAITDDLTSGVSGNEIRCQGGTTSLITIEGAYLVIEYSTTPGGIGIPLLTVQYEEEIALINGRWA